MDEGDQRATRPIDALPASTYLAVVNSVDALNAEPFIQPGMNLFQGMEHQPVPRNSPKWVERMHRQLHCQGINHDVKSLLSAALHQFWEETVSKKKQKQTKRAGAESRVSASHAEGPDNRKPGDLAGQQLSKDNKRPSASPPSRTAEDADVPMSPITTKSCIAQKLFTNRGKRPREADPSRDQNQNVTGALEQPYGDRCCFSMPFHHQSTGNDSDEDEEDDQTSEWGDDDEDDDDDEKKDDEDPPPDSGSGFASPETQDNSEKEPDDDHGHGGSQEPQPMDVDMQGSPETEQAHLADTDLEELIAHLVKYLKLQSDNFPDPMVVPFGKGVAAVAFDQKGRITEAVYIMCHSFWCPKDPAAPLNFCDSSEEEDEDLEPFPRCDLSDDEPFTDPSCPFLLTANVAIKYKVEVKAILKGIPKAGDKICRGGTLTALVEQYSRKDNGGWIDNQPNALLMIQYAVLLRLSSFMPFSWELDSNGRLALLLKEAGKVAMEDACLKTYGIGRLFALMEYLYRQEDLKYRQAKIDHDSRWKEMPLVGRVPSWRPGECLIPPQVKCDEKGALQKRRLCDRNPSEALLYIKTVIEEEAVRRIKRAILETSDLRKQNKDTKYYVPIIRTPYSTEDPTGCFSSIAVSDRPVGPDGRMSRNGKTNSRTKREVIRFCVLGPQERPESVGLSELPPGVVKEEAQKLLEKQNKDDWIKDLPRLPLIQAMNKSKFIPNVRRRY